MPLQQFGNSEKYLIIYIIYLYSTGVQLCCPLFGLPSIGSCTQIAYRISSEGTGNCEGKNSVCCRLTSSSLRRQCGHWITCMRKRRNWAASHIWKAVWLALRPTQSSSVLRHTTRRFVHPTPHTCTLKGHHTLITYSCSTVVGKIPR